MQRDRVTVGGDAADNRRGLVRDVAIDQEEGRVDPLTREDVEQIRRRRRVRAVVEREIDRRRVGTRHVPDRTPPGEGVEEERHRCRVRKCQDAGADGDEDPHGKVRLQADRFVTFAV